MDQACRDKLAARKAGAGGRAEECISWTLQMLLHDRSVVAVYHNLNHTHTC